METITEHKSKLRSNIIQFKVLQITKTIVDWVLCLPLISRNQFAKT